MYVKRDGLIYDIMSPTVYDSRNHSLMYNLELVCGWDYVSPDYSDTQGWVSPNMFIDEVQDEYYLVLYDESLKSRLEEDGFEFIDKLPFIHVIKDEF